MKKFIKKNWSKLLNVVALVALFFSIIFKPSNAYISNSGRIIMFFALAFIVFIDIADYFVNDKSNEKNSSDRP